jgi:hypothetical protein
MKKQAVKIPPMYSVTWIDITEDGGWHHDIENIEEHCPPRTCVDIGFIVKRTKLGILITGGIGYDGHAKVGAYASTKIIPYGVIQEIVRLKDART